MPMPAAQTGALEMAYLFLLHTRIFMNLKTTFI
jgi:hypothetical protein